MLLPKGHQLNNPYQPSYADKRLFAIQKSTRSRFRAIQKLNEKLRLRFKWYYDFRIDPLYLFNTPDEQMLAIQKSTRTTIKRLQPLHEKLRQKSTRYYKWHIRPQSHKVHWGILGIYTAAVIVGVTIGLLGGKYFPAKANYQFGPVTGTIVVGTAQNIVANAAANAEGVNVGVKGLMANDDYHWVVGSTAAGYDLNIALQNIQLHGANTMMVQFELDEDATAPASLVQICDWVSSTGVDSPADTYCTTGGWRTLNLRNATTAPTSASAYHYQIYNGYWGDGATGYDTPLTNFIDSGNSNTAKIRFYSVTNTTTLVSIDYLHIFCVINPMYSPASMVNNNANAGAASSTSGINLRGIAKDTTYMYLAGDDGSNWRIEKRYLSNGSLVTAFGTNGVITSTASSFATDIAIDNTYMYVTGSTAGAWRVEKRRLDTGVYDANFGSSGALTCDAASASLNDIAIDSTYMHLAGTSDDNTARIEKRSLSSGSADSNFGTNGVISFSGSFYAVANSIAINDGYMYVFGDVDGVWHTEKRSLSSGSVDNNFGTNGILTGANGATVSRDIVVSGSYLYLVGVQSIDAGPYDWRIEKRAISNGSVDSNFGTNGILSIESESDPNTVLISGSFLFVAGSDNNGYWSVEKRAVSDGDLDNAFGTNGVLTVNNGVGSYIYGGVLDSGFLYLGGVASSRWRIEKRFLSDGSLDTSAGFGLANGDYKGTQIGVIQTGSDDIRIGMAGTAGSVADFYYSFKNVKTYTGLNTILVRAEHDCDVTNAGLTYRPKIWNFTSGGTGAWEDLTTGSIACTTTDATNAWSKSGITPTDYISSGEIRVGFYGLQNGTHTIRTDFIYIMTGTTNADTNKCEISFGSNSAGDCANTANLDMTAASPNTWNILTEDLSNTQGHDFYPYDNANATSGEAASSHVKFSVTQPANSAITGVLYASRHMSGTAGTVYPSLRDYTGYIAGAGGFTDITATSTTSLTYSDNYTLASTGNGGIQGLNNQPFAYFNSNTNEMWMRLRTSTAGGSANNSVNQWDFAFVAPQWIEDENHPTKSFQFTPTASNVVTGTAQAVQGATAATAEGVNTGWKGTLASDNDHWVVASTTSGYDMNLEVANVALNNANQLTIETSFDLDATTPDTRIQICDWTSSTGVDNAADAQCTGGGWRSLNLRKINLAPTSLTAYHYQIYNGYWGASGSVIDTPLTNFVNSSDNNKIKIRYYSHINTTTTVAIDYLRIYATSYPIYQPAGMTDMNSTVPGYVTSTSGHTPYAIAKDSTYMYIGGRDATPDWRIEKRFLSTGTLETAFGTSGVVTGVADSDIIQDIAIDGTYMYVVGTNRTDCSTMMNCDWRIEKRRLDTGALDAGFGTGGVVVADATSTYANSIAIDSTYMYVVGAQSGSLYRIEKRALSNGALDNGFGTNGVISGEVNSNQARKISIDNTHMYIAGNDNVAGWFWRFEKRLLSDGTLDNSFGTNGVIIEGGSATDICRDMVIDGNYLYAVGRGTGGSYWRIEKRALSNGALDNGFGTNGIVTGDASTNVAFGVSIDSSNIYIAGDNGSDWRIEKRLISNGSLVDSFGNSGIVTSDSTTQYPYGGIIIDTSSEPRMALGVIPNCEFI